MFTFIKNVFVRGLVFLIPVVVLYITLRELVEIMIGFATPIADMFPPGYFREDDSTELIAIFLILATAFTLGLIFTLKPTRAAAGWLADKTLNRIPMYRMLTSLVSAFLNLEDEKSFKPAQLSHADGLLEPVYVIEEHGEDMYVIMQPWTPTPFAGSLKVVPRDRIELIPVSLDEYSIALTHFGLGLSKALGKKKSM